MGWLSEDAELNNEEQVGLPGLRGESLTGGIYKGAKGHQGLQVTTVELWRKEGYIRGGSFNDGEDRDSRARVVIGY